MRVWYFTEQPYPEAWATDLDSLRITLPSGKCDPKIAGRRLNNYLDQWVLADQLGLDIMVNEHHATATCMSPSCLLNLAILARQTRNARLLALGVPIANRPDPLRVAEELAVIDVISEGRLEIGMVKGAPYEIPVANLNPVRMMDRFWEAHDLILKALGTDDGPFHWEGEYYHYKNVNVWPRAYQYPHPPIWITASGAGSGKIVAQHRYVAATLLGGYNAKVLFDAYRDEYLARHGEPAPLDRLAYLGLVAVADNREKAWRRGDIIADYIKTSPIVATQFTNPPGYSPMSDTVRALMAAQSGLVGAYSRIPTKSGGHVHPAKATTQQLVDAGVLFVGTPDEVYNQIVEFDQAVGGFGHLLMMAQGGNLSHEDTCDNLTRFAQDVYPRLRERARATVFA